MKGRHTTALFLGVADFVAVLFVFNAIAISRGVTPWYSPFFFPLILPALFFAVAIYLIEGYSANTDFISLDYTSVHIIATILVMFVTLLVTFVFFPEGFALNRSRAVIGFAYLALTPITIGYRRMWHLRVGQRRRQRTVVFIGDRANCLDFQFEFRRMNPIHPLVCCTAGEGASPEAADLITLRAALDSIASGTIEPEALVLREANPQLAPDVSDALMKLYFSGVPVYTLEFFHEIFWRKIPRYRLNQIWLFQGGFQITREPVFEHIKRLTDLFLAGFGLVVFSPLLLLGALGIMAGGDGPVLFAQTRIGRNRVPFRMYKFRTMRDRPSGDLYTQKDDDRITPFGRLLRNTRLDEVPQLWNVLRGEMSLIGPRAEWDRLVERYEREIPCYHFRHLVKPGITGWAQVNYPYGANMDDTMRKLEYDLYYIRHFSFHLDATIVLKTIHIMLFGKGR